MSRVDHDTLLPTALGLPPPVGLPDGDGPGGALEARAFAAVALLLRPADVLSVAPMARQAAFLRAGWPPARARHSCGLRGLAPEMVPVGGLGLVHLASPDGGALRVGLRLLSPEGWLLVSGQDVSSQVRDALLDLLTGLRAFSLYVRAGDGLALVRPAPRAQGVAAGPGW